MKGQSVLAFVACSAVVAIGSFSLGMEIGVDIGHDAGFDEGFRRGRRLERDLSAMGIVQRIESRFDTVYVNGHKILVKKGGER